MDTAQPSPRTRGPDVDRGVRAGGPGGGPELGDLQSTVGPWGRGRHCPTCSQGQGLAEHSLVPRQALCLSPSWPCLPDVHLVAWWPRPASAQGPGLCPLPRPLPFSFASWAGLPPALPLPVLLLAWAVASLEGRDVWAPRAEPRAALS